MFVDRKIVQSEGKPYSLELYSVTNEKPHYHEGVLEILLCLSGTVTVTSTAEVLTLESGDLFSFDADDIHYATASGDNLIVSFYFDLSSDAFEQDNLMYLIFACNKYLPDMSPEMTNHLYDLNALLLSLMASELFPGLLPEQSQSNSIALSREIMSMMTDYFQFLSVDKDATQFSADARDLFARIMGFLMDHYNEKITLQSLADFTHHEANYLSQLMKKIDGEGFKNLLYKARVYKSSHLLLENPHLSVPEVSDLCGFSDVKFFFREFKKNYYGITPHQFIIKYREYSKTARPNRYFDPNDLPFDMNRILLEQFITAMLHKHQLAL
ncbi:MAG: helix-turn-helix domain-containing protein [Bilifractor sp.]